MPDSRTFTGGCHCGQIRFEAEEIQRRDPAWIVRRGISHVPEGREVFPLLTIDEMRRFENQPPLTDAQRAEFIRRPMAPHPLAPIP